MTGQVLTSVPAIDGGSTLFDWLAWMRDEHPVWRDEQGAYHIFRYADVQRVISDPPVFSNDPSRVFPSLADKVAGNMNALDPPAHRRLRQLASQSFTPRIVAALEKRITEVTNELLDAAPGDRFDLVECLTHPLPVIVIAELLGVPIEDRDQLRIWVDRLLALQGTIEASDDDFLDRMEAATGEMNSYLLRLCHIRRDDPRDDLISRLVYATIDDDRLSDAELVNITSVLFHTGHVTTTLLLGNAVEALHSFPHAAAELRRDPALIPAAVEEVLRYRSPFTTVSRSTTRDVEVAGTVIPANQQVTPWIISANHDERQFPEPRVLDIHRDTSNIAFGHGVHFCLGAPLARLEGRIALRALLDRYADIRVDRTAAITYHPPGMYGAKNLPVIVSRPAGADTPA